MAAGEHTGRRAGSRGQRISPRTVYLSARAPPSRVSTLLKRAPEQTDRTGRRARAATTDITSVDHNHRHHLFASESVRVLV